MKQKKLLALAIVAIIAITYPGFAFSTAVHGTVSHTGTEAPKSTHYIYDASPVKSSSSNGTIMTQSAVNPSRLYSKEPAPMGIADYGLGPGGTPYEYTTNSFEGMINISNLQTYNASLTSSYYGYRYGMSFQLNTVLSFIQSGKTYVYWTQDVAFLNTSNRTMYIIDNVWNLSSSKAKIQDSTISGTGIVNASSGFYYDIGGVPTGSKPGENYPFALGLRINTTLTSGVPTVEFQYNAGSGWITFDSPEFVFASGSSAPAFVVNGSSYTPFGNFYDSELILGGPAGSSQTNATSSSVRLSLLYWNGHNYQAVQNAFNHGSNTAEGIGNVTVSAGGNTESSTPLANVSTGSGNLGILYDRSNIAILNVSVPLASSGTLFVNGTAYPFTGPDVNVTLIPGSYPVSVNTSSKQYNLGDLTLTAGGYRAISTQNIYFSNFMETGLPSGTRWYVNLSGAGSYSSSASTISVALPNGSYSYTVATMNKDYYNHTAGTLTVNGAGQSINVTFNPYLYSVLFKESGLNTSTRWAVFFDNSTVNSSTGSQIGFMSINGTYSFWVQIVLGYASNVTFGSITVNGIGITQDVAFSNATDYNISFTETGLKSGSLWYLNLTNGQSENSTSPTIVYEMPNGTFGYYDSAGPRYSTVRGQVEVNGSDKNISLNFIELGMLNLTVSQSGTSLYLNGNYEGKIGNTFTKYILPGAYILSDSLNGYQTFADYFVISSGKNVSISINLTPMLYYGFLEGSLTPGNATITANGFLIPAFNGSFDASLPTGTYYVTVSANGYHSLEFQITVLLLNVSWHNVSLVPSKSILLSGYVEPYRASVVAENYTAYVNSSGYYFIWLQPGNYTVSVYAYGYFPESIPINVSSGTEKNFTLRAEPAVTSSDRLGDILAVGFGIKVSNLSKSGGIISATFSATSTNGSLIITVPFSSLGGVNISELLNSRVYVGNQQYSNFSVVISSNHTVILYVYGLHGDPTISWLYSPDASLHVFDPLLGYIVLAVLIAAIAGIYIALRRRK
ncbi:MAG: thermopsin family protease [Thermoplasmataceae archaeon]